MISDPEKFWPRHFGVYTVNLLSEREKLGSEDYLMELTVNVSPRMSPEKRLKLLSRLNHHHDGLLFVPAINQSDDKHSHCSPYMSCMIDPKQVDLGLLQRWIKKCQDKHTACRLPQDSIDKLGIALTVVDFASSTRLLYHEIGTSLIRLMKSRRQRNWPSWTTFMRMRL
ncbi:hypothetical protein HD806DRAFT_16692 [Xylariaceae sp. AK1471]|nr:hypothetical protein HD806DRAFT_16692 [Xylariaceae sp. AK1471]